MSLKGQIAFGKNIILQKKCEQACNKYKNNLRQSRRRINTLEEDCVTSLYHLLLDAKGGQGQSNSKISSVPDTQPKNEAERRRAKSAVHGHRPASTKVSDGQQGDGGLLRRPSTTSLKNYHISYSFVKDGMDISSVTRDVNKNQNRNNSAKTELTIHASNRGPHKQTTTSGIQVRINDVTGELPDQNKVDKSSSNEIEKSDNSKSQGMLNRLQIRNGLKSASFAGPSDNKDGLTFSDKAENKRRSMTDLDEIGKDSNFQIRPATVIGHARRAESPVKNGKPKSHALFKVTKQGEEDSNNDLISDSENTSPKAGSEVEEANSTIRDSIEETVIVDKGETENDQNQGLIIVSDQEKRRRCASSIARINPRPKSTPNLRPRSRKKSSSSGIDQEQEDILQQTAERTQGFLKDYAKKSKLFSYVVNANASSAAPRGRKIYRSPSVTYQELVSIKAGIKKQLLQTRVIVQKSARLSSYVNKISNQVTRRAEKLEQLY